MDKGEISKSTSTQVSSSFECDFVNLIFGLVAVICALILALEVITNVYQFLVVLVIGLIGGYLIENAFSSTITEMYDGSLPSEPSVSSYQGWASQKMAPTNHIAIWTTLSTGYLFCQLLFNKIDYKYWAKAGLAKVVSAINLVWTVVVYALSLYSNIYDDDGVGKIATFISGLCIVMGIILFTFDTPIDAEAISIVTLNTFISGVGIFLDYIV